jgi:Uma2 family endonuclease
MSSQTTVKLTPEEYLEIERKAERKSEFYRGEMFAMAGASSEHGTIVTNLVAEIRPQIRGRCRVWSNDLRLRVSPTGVYTYPDIVVACGEPKFADSHLDTLLNPTVIIEVLFPTTRGYDRSWKFHHYRTLDSLSEYLTVAQDSPLVTRCIRLPNNKWEVSDVEGLDKTIMLESIGCTLRMASIYEDVPLPEAGRWGEDDPGRISRN